MQVITPYLQLMRLNKPIGILLLLWPTLTALVIASRGWPQGHIALIFIIGTVLMRSAGCVVNDLADRKFDGHVNRTQYRPLVTGAVSVKSAIILTIALCVCAFALVLFLNKLTILLSFFALFFAVLYPMTKRFFAIPQAYLGVAFGFGILMAFTAIEGRLPTIAWILFIANLTWAIAYDTEYAMVDREDDLKVGIKSSAITFGQYDVLMVMLCYLVTVLLYLIVGINIQAGWLFYIALFIATAIACYHYFLIKARQTENCFKAFMHNHWFGCILFVGVLVDQTLIF